MERKIKAAKEKEAEKEAVSRREIRSKFAT